MTSGPTEGPDLSPEEAFVVLGNETRLKILQVLGDHGGVMSFTALRNAVGIRQGGQFNYHLDKLVGHFVAKTEAGYSLRIPGQRIVEAVLSGTVTMDPKLDLTELEFTCRICGHPISVSYQLERLELYCSGCAGQYKREEKGRESVLDTSDGWLGGYQLSPAGAVDRNPIELLYASSLRSHLANVARSNGLCPACDGRVERVVTVCEDHSAQDGLCDVCQRRHAIQVTISCTQCPDELDGMAVNVLVADLGLRRFVADQGIDPLTEGFRWGWDYEEQIHSTDPLDASFIFEVNGETIAVTVNESLDVVDMEVDPP